MGYRAKTTIKLGEGAGGRGGREEEREGACVHSFDAAVSPPCNQPVNNMSTR